MRRVPTIDLRALGFEEDDFYSSCKSFDSHSISDNGYKFKELCSKRDERVCSFHACTFVVDHNPDWTNG